MYRLKAAGEPENPQPLDRYADSPGNMSRQRFKARRLHDSAAKGAPVTTNHDRADTRNDEITQYRNKSYQSELLHYLCNSSNLFTLDHDMVERIIVGPLYTNAYIVSTGKKECIVIDPGDEAEKLCTRLESLNLVPQAILCTHGHLDHTSAAVEIQRHYQHERDHHIPIGIHAEDAEFFGDDAERRHQDCFLPLGDNATRVFEQLRPGIARADFEIAVGEPLLDSDLVAFATPGHTPGSVSFYSETRGIVWSGDTLLFKSVGRTDLNGGSGDELLRSISSVLYSLPAETRLFPGHGPFSSIEREKLNNPLLEGERTF